MPVMLPVVPIVLASGLALARGLAVAYERSTHAMLLEALRTGTTREVRAVEDGELARIVGKAELAEQTLTAPLSGRSCFAWQVSVWAPLTTRAWRKALDHGEQVPFSVVDATGRAVIETRRVRSYAAVDHEERGSGPELSEAARAFLAARGCRRWGRACSTSKRARSYRARARSWWAT